MSLKWYNTQGCPVSTAILYSYNCSSCCDIDSEPVDVHMIKAQQGELTKVHEIKLREWFTRYYTKQTKHIKTVQ